MEFKVLNMIFKKYILCSNWTWSYIMQKAIKRENILVIENIHELTD